MTPYQEFLERRAQLGSDDGFAPEWMPDYLFDFQRHLVDWSLRRGRSAIFADCGLGKTPMQLAWAENVCRHTGGRVLILTPLAVAEQTVREAEKFGIDCQHSRDGTPAPRITVTNYERLSHFAAADFAGVVCDESSRLKAFDAATRVDVTEFMRRVRYRLLCTATAAPNDYTELGTSSEALGYLGHIDMLNRFFKNDQNSSSLRRKFDQAPKWRFKGHAEHNFWRWVCSWGRALRRPSDLGYDDADFILPELREQAHLVEAIRPPEGMLFNLPAVGLHEQREEQRRTIQERCEKAAELVYGGDYAIVWCHLNPEGDLLEKLIDGAIQVSGSDADDEKERKLRQFADGQARVLVTKPKIGAWGLNFQHCNHMTFFPSHSFEQYYQSVRRCWRFGQEREVKVDVVTTEGGKHVFDNLQAKATAADRMFTNLVATMNDHLAIDRSYAFPNPAEVPSWL